MNLIIFPTFVTVYKDALFLLLTTVTVLTVTSSSLFAVCLIIQAAEKTQKVFQFSAVLHHMFRQHTRHLKVTCVFSLQRSIQSRGTLTAAPATCLSCMMASGSTAVPAQAVRMVTSGAPPPTTTAKTSAGASAL